MANWEYGGVYKKYNLVEDEIFNIDELGKVMVHDLTKGLPEFMREADVLFVDPPWNKGNLSTFYTKADKDYRLDSFEFFYTHLFNSIKEIHPKLCFVEIGKENLHNFIIEMKKIYKYVTFYNSTYYHKKNSLCYIVQGSDKRAITEPSCILPMSIVLNPAVLDVADMKKEAKIFPFKLKPSIEPLLCSKIKKARLPTRIRMLVIDITTLEWRVKFLNFLFLYISR